MKFLLAAVLFLSSCVTSGDLARIETMQAQQAELYANGEVTAEEARKSVIDEIKAVAGDVEARGKEAFATAKSVGVELLLWTLGIGGPAYVGRRKIKQVVVAGTKAAARKIGGSSAPPPAAG